MGSPEGLPEAGIWEESKVKKYKITYPIVCVLPAVAMFLYMFLYQKVGVFYSVCFGVLAGGSAFLLARIILQNFIDGNNDPKTWQITIYGLVSVGGWVGAIFAETWGWTSIFLCMVACGLLLALGTRFLKDEDGNGIPDIFERKREKKEEVSAEYMYDHMLFKLVDDKLGNPADHNRPLCVAGGQAYTVSEALAKGLDDLAGKGIEYIDGLFAVKKEENET